MKKLLLTVLLAFTATACVDWKPNESDGPNDPNSSVDQTNYGDLYINFMAPNRVAQIDTRELGFVVSGTRCFTTQSGDYACNESDLDTFRGNLQDNIRIQDGAQDNVTLVWSPTCFEGGTEEQVDFDNDGKDVAHTVYLVKNDVACTVNVLGQYYEDCIMYAPGPDNEAVASAENCIDVNCTAYEIVNPDAWQECLAMCYEFISPNPKVWPGDYDELVRCCSGEQTRFAQPSTVCDPFSIDSPEGTEGE